MFKCNWKLPENAIEQAGGACINTKYLFFSDWLYIHCQLTNESAKNTHGCCCSQSRGAYLPVTSLQLEIEK